MARVFILTIVLATLMIGLQIAGIGLTSGSSILGMFGFTSTQSGAAGWWNSGFVTDMLIVIGGATLVGGIASFIGRSPDPTYLIGGAITGFLIFFIVDMGTIVKTAYTNFPDMLWIGNVLSIVFFGLTAGYCVALYQWWRGIDP